jgi:hypothetical protein
MIVSELLAPETQHREPELGLADIAAQQHGLTNIPTPVPI